MLSKDLLMYLEADIADATVDAECDCHVHRIDVSHHGGEQFRLVHWFVMTYVGVLLLRRA